MEIKAFEIENVSPYQMGSRGPTGIKITVNIRENQLEELFYTIWEFVDGAGCETIKKWVEAEGYTLTKVTPL